MKFEDVIAVMAEHETKHASDEPDDSFVMRQMALSLLSVSAGSQQLLYFAGSKFGRKLEIDGDDREAVIEELKPLFDRWDFGILELTEDSESVTVDESIFVQELETTTDKPVCFFIAGLLAGGLRSGIGTKFVVNEVACQGQDDDTCRFRVRQA